MRWLRTIDPAEMPKWWFHLSYILAGAALGLRLALTLRGMK